MHAQTHLTACVLYAAAGRIRSRTWPTTVWAAPMDVAPMICRSWCEIKSRTSSTTVAPSESTQNKAENLRCSDLPSSGFRVELYTSVSDSPSRCPLECTCCQMHVLLGFSTPDDRGYMCVYSLSLSPTRTHTRTHHTQTHAHARTHTYMYAHTNTHLSIHTHTYMHINIYLSIYLLIYLSIIQYAYLYIC